MKASEIINESCCGQGLPIDCTKDVLTAKVKKLEQQIKSYQSRVCNMCDGHGMVGNILDSVNCPDCEEKERKYLIDIIHGAANHLRQVMEYHPYCDHVQVVKHFADIQLKNRTIF